MPRAVTANCARCHGVDGRGRGVGAFPKLAGQRSTYLLAALQAFARGARHSGIMEPIAAGLSLEEMRELALYYGTLPEQRRRPRPSSHTGDRARPGDRQPRHPESTCTLLCRLSRPWRHPPQSGLSRARRPVCRLSRPAALSSKRPTAAVRPMPTSCARLLPG